jgi:membrane protein DedA with SNARE-associated domain
LRLGAAFRATLLLGLSLRLHHHFHGPPIDYGALAAASAASWIGVPGPGEPVLIAAGVFAAQHRLDIVSVLVIAWAAATVGGIGGWLLGMKAGRTLLSAPGPLHRPRLKAVARGDQVFARIPVLAVLLAPSWVAGIHRVRARLFLPLNAIAAAIWACGIGLGAFYVGPTVIDVVNDVGWVTGIALLLLVAGTIAVTFTRRRRRGQRGGDAASAG